MAEWEGSGEKEKEKVRKGGGGYKLPEPLSMGFETRVNEPAENRQVD